MAGSLGGIQAGKSYVTLLLDDKDFKAGLHKAQRELREWGGFLSRIGAGIAAVGGGLLGGFALITKQIADLETATRRFDLIFRDVADSMRRELQKISDATKVPMSSLIREAATFGAVFNEMREAISGEQFVQVIGKTMQAGLDLAAVAGISLPEAFERLKSGFTSTGESVDQFGFNLRKANLEAEAQRLGMKQSILTMSEQQKQLLKLSIFMRQSSRTGVNFVEMVDTINGQLTLFTANLVELAYRAGWAVKIAMVPLIRAFNYMLIALRPLATLLSPILVALGGLGAVLTTAGAGILGIGALFQISAFAIAGWTKFAAKFRDIVKDLQWAMAFVNFGDLMAAGWLKWGTVIAFVNDKLLLTWKYLVALWALMTATPLGRFFLIMAAGYAGAKILKSSLESDTSAQGSYPTMRYLAVKGAGGNVIKHQIPDYPGDRQLRIGLSRLGDVARAVSPFLKKQFDVFHQPPEPAQAAAQRASAGLVAVAGGFGGDFVHRFGYASSVSGVAETNSKLGDLNSMIQKMMEDDKLKVKMHST